MKKAPPKKSTKAPVRTAAAPADAKTGYAAPELPGKGEFANVRIAILSTRWNVGIVDALGVGARACLKAWGVPAANVREFRAPGAYEMPLAALKLLAHGRYDGVVTLGAVIKGDTPHFDFVAGECARGLIDVQLRTGKAVGFGVLTTNTVEQAWARAGKGPTNKGYEATAAMLEMIRFGRALS